MNTALAPPMDALHCCSKYGKPETPHWVASPQLCNASNAKVLFQPERTWSVDGAAWAGAQLRVVLSKYPGGQTRPTLVTFIDCEREVARVEEGCEVPLGALEPELNRFLLRAR